VLIRESFEASRKRYGSPRVWEDLGEQKIRVSRKRVVRLMQEQGLKARARKRFKSTTMSDHDQPVESAADEDMQGSLKAYQQSPRPAQIAKRLSAVFAHDAYHAGQIQYVRALQGIPAAE